MRFIAKDFNLIEISAVDLTAKAIISLFDKQNLSNNIYHVFNPHLFNIAEIFKDFQVLPVTELTLEQFVDNILDNLGNSIYHNLIIRFLLRQWWLDRSYTDYLNSIKVLQDKTLHILKKLDFEWLPISSNMLNKYLGLIKVHGVSKMIKDEKALKEKPVISNFNSEIQKQKHLFELIEHVTSAIPVFIYWKDKNGVYLGANEFSLKSFGFDSIDDLIGKTDYDLWPELAEKYLADDRGVMETGEILRKEDIFFNPNDPTHEIRYCVVTKAPLYDENNNIIGVIGNSIDITAEKREAELRVKNAEQKAETLQAQLEEQAKFRKTAGQVAHDIRSPLMTLSMATKNCQDVPESIRICMREAINSINDIANGLLSKYQVDESGNSSEVNNNDAKIDSSLSSCTAVPVDIDKAKRMQEQSLSATENSIVTSTSTENCECTVIDKPNIDTLEQVIPSLLTLRVLSDKKYQYQDLPIKFESEITPKGYLAFIAAEPTSFKRMLSNIINNAVESLDSKEGEIIVKLDATPSQVKITIQDNGKGMTPEVIEKITHNISVSRGKKSGHGLGLIQVQETLDAVKGNIEINSKPNQGTCISLTFPRITAAAWFAEEIRIKPHDTIVVLDDDNSIHQAWEICFKPYLTNDIKLVHFNLGEDAIIFINNLFNNDEILLLADFELLKQKMNGLEVINHVHSERSILVTSHYANKEIQQKSLAIRTKILPKELASEVPIIFDAKIKRDVNLIIVDDDTNLLKTIRFSLPNLVVDLYDNPNDLLVRLDKYNKNTKICIDHNLGPTVACGGIGIAKKLHQAGFTNIGILSGEIFDANENLDYITFYPKSDIDIFEKIRNDLHQK